MPTVKVRRANVVMNIKESEAERYLSLGYDIIDDNGNIIKKSVPNDLGTLKAEYDKISKENEALKAENAKLKAEVAKLKKSAKTKE